MNKFLSWPDVNLTPLKRNESNPSIKDVGNVSLADIELTVQLKLCPWLHVSRINGRKSWFLTEMAGTQYRYLREYAAGPREAKRQ